VIAGFGPRGELPSPSPSLSSPPLPFLLPCAPPSSPSRAPRRLGLLRAGVTALHRTLASGGGGLARARPRAPPARPCPEATASLAARPRVPAPPHARQRRLGPAAVAPACPTAAARPRARARRQRRLGPTPARLVPGGSAPCPSRPLPQRPRPRPRGPSASHPAAWRPAAPVHPTRSAPRCISHAPAPRVPAVVCSVGPVTYPGVRAACSHARNCSCAAFDSQLYLFFNFSLVDVLRRTLRRTAIHFKFIFINVLCRALCCTTIQFKFIFVNDLCRALRRTTFRFKTQFS
jgi:hypothetical protein